MTSSTGTSAVVLLSTAVAFGHVTEFGTAVSYTVPNKHLRFAVGCDAGLGYPCRHRKSGGMASCQWHPRTGNDSANPYDTRGDGTRYVIIDEVPPDGFVLTDIITDSAFDTYVHLQEDSGHGPLTKLRCRLGNVAGTQQYHFNSGIRFTPGAVVLVDYAGPSSDYPIVISGYIPRPGGPDPLISPFSLAVGALLSTGAVVVRRLHAPA